MLLKNKKEKKKERSCQNHTTTVSKIIYIAFFCSIALKTFYFEFSSYSNELCDQHKELLGWRLLQPLVAFQSKVISNHPCPFLVFAEALQVLILYLSGSTQHICHALPSCAHPWGFFYLIFYSPTPRLTKRDNSPPQLGTDLKYTTQFCKKMKTFISVFKQKLNFQNS